VEAAFQGRSGDDGSAKKVKINARKEEIRKQKIVPTKNQTQMG